MLITALQTVYVQKCYLFLSAIFWFLIVVGSLLWTNTALVQSVLLDQNVSGAFKLNFIWSLLIGAPVSMGWFTFTLLLITTLLLSVVVSMGVYVYRHRRHLAHQGKALAVTTSGGVLATFFGVGCAACGSLLLGGLLAALGGSGFLLLLPLHGGEFGIVAVVLLVFAIYSLAKIITTPAVCSVD